MARCLSLLSLATSVLLLAVSVGGAQSPGQPPAPPPGVGSPPKPPEPAPTTRELTTQEIDALIEKTFGKDCPELKRPLRAWFADLDMVIAAEKVRVAPNHLAAHFTSASIGFGNKSIDLPMIQGDEIVLDVTRPIAVGVVKAITHLDGDNDQRVLRELKTRRVAKIEVHRKDLTITLFQRDDANTVFATVGTKIGSTPAALPPPPPIEGPPATPIVEVGAGSVRTMDLRFKFKIDPKTPLKELLPTPPRTKAKLAPWTNEDLAKVPELTFGEPISKELSKHKAMEDTAHIMAKINHLNLKKTDGFMLAMLDQRNDLRGLPFLMGEECRTREEQAKVFAIAADQISRTKLGNSGRNVEAGDHLEGMMQTMLNATPANERDKVYRAGIAAMTQILMPEAEGYRLGMAKYLARVPHADAARALARLAIYSAEESVRAAAIEGLKLRRDKDYTDILIQGFRYPLPTVSKRAAEALVKLERKDVLANLVDVLDSPDPRLPATEKRDGKDVSVVRELVKVNHHRNCLLCHAPGNTDNTPEGILKVAVPLPTEPLPKPQDGGGYQSMPPTSDIVVRLDMTYLRQDFSLMMPVADAHPWPEMQRFDFLVRTRTLTTAEAQAFEPCCEMDEPGRLSPYHRAALFALRELTGRDTEPTAAAWRKLLKLTARN